MASRATSFAAGTDLGQLSTNQYWDGSNHRYIAAGNSSIYTQNDGAHIFSGAPSGSAGGAITYVTGLTISADGEVQKPTQPAFLAVAVAQNNIPINANTTVTFSSQVFDLGSNYSGSVFTAPVTGKYQLNLSLYVLNIDSAADYVQVSMNTSNRQYYAIVDPGVWTGDPVYWSFAITVLADMDAGDTAHVEVQLNNTGAAQMDVTANSAFSGYLVA